MLKLLPILLAVAYGLVVWHFSVRRLHAELDEKSAELAEPGLRALAQRMAEAIDLPRIRVHVYDIEPVNGLAAPDGRIFITRGFLQKYRAGEVTAEEIASVIAHELGHVALGHSRRRLIDFSGQNAMRTALALLLNRIVPGLGAWVATMLTTLVAARLSRKDEYEADAYATALLIKSGIGAAPQKSLLAKLDRMTAASGAAPAWFMSHPKADQRIAAIAANEAKWTGGALP